MGDDQRLRRTIEQHRLGVEKLTILVKKALRRQVYSEVLLQAARRNDVSTVRAALKLGADADHRDGHGNNAEMIAGYSDLLELETLLFELRVKPLAHRMK